MKIKKQGKCLKCSEMYSSTKASSHLLKCISQTSVSSQSKPEGLLVRVSGTGHLNLYWMYIAVSVDVSLGQLDQFLRDIWLECCGHLSEFTIDGCNYCSHTETGRISRCMNNRISQLLSLDLKFEYVYDFGSSTELELEVINRLPTCPRKGITLLMRNDPPSFSCLSCKKKSEMICSMCGEITCVDCAEDHSCAVSEGDTYMLVPLVNSPRTGVCGYTGSEIVV